MFILTVSGVLQINNALKSYLTSLYFKNNNPIILILALPFICDFNLLFIYFYYNFLFMFSYMFVYFSFSFLNFALFQDGSLVSQWVMHIKFLFDHLDQLKDLLQNITPSMDPFVLDLKPENVSIDTTPKDSNILFLKSEGSSQGSAVLQNSGLYEGQPVHHVQAINNATNLNQISSALEAVRVDPNISYKVKYEMLSHSHNVYLQHFTYLYNSATNNNDLATITQAKEGLSYCNNVIPQLIETIPNKPTIAKL